VFVAPRQRAHHKPHPTSLHSTLRCWTLKLTKVWSAENITANTPIVDLLKQIAEKKNATAAQISLSWLLAQKPWIVPIPGTSKIDHLNENLGAINVQLTPADLREIETALSEITVHGGRMNEEQMKVVDQTA
jgi:aryl-alcohol dehydrogenase-like predicted oxidoreductase